MQGDAASMEAPMRSTIMDSNSFKPSDLDGLDPQTRELVERRQVLGPSYRLFYKHPLHFVKGLGTRLYTADGEEYLDAYNNVVSVGHCHPHVVEAICRQVSTLNTHTRYLHEGIVDYAEHLVALLPPEVDRVMFECSGSEANDLAVRVARAATGGTGVIVTSEAYHGNTALITGLSPSIGADQPMLPDMRMIPTPDTWRLGTNDIGAWMAARVAEQIADMRRHGFKFAALLVDSIFSSDGVYPGAPSSLEAREGFLKPVVDLVHKEGGLFIADEVQPGFARTGEAFWGFERHGIVPDIVTMGKPMANGMPCSAMAARHEVLEAFSSQTPYFNTFAGNPVSMAAAQAVLEVLQGEHIQQNALETGLLFKNALIDAAKRHPCLGDVRGAGFFIGADVVKPGTKEPDYEHAVDFIEAMREHHVLTSLCGPAGNILKIRPPLVFSPNDVDIFMDALEKSLAGLGL